MLSPLSHEIWKSHCFAKIHALVRIRIYYTIAFFVKITSRSDKKEKTGTHKLYIFAYNLDYDLFSECQN